MLALRMVFLLFSIILIVYAQQLTKNANNYGPYNVDFQNYSDCKGPKAKNLTAMSVSLDENYINRVNITFFADSKLDDMKIHVYNIKDDKKNYLWNYKLSDPCKHYSFAYMIKQYLKAENCFIKKGFYSSQLSMKEVMFSFLGTSFFYGNYSFKAYLTSKKGNIACVTSTIIFSKKT